MILKKIKKTLWPSLDDAAQSIYDNSRNKETVEMKFSPYVYSYARKTITLLVTAGLITAYVLNKEHNYIGKFIDDMKGELKGANIIKELEEVFYNKK